MEGMPGPKTMAEINAGFQSWFLALIVGICGVIFILPMFRNEIIINREGYGAIIIGALIALVTTVPIIPFSLKSLSQSIIRS
jgi:hypothetical protein